MGALDDQMDNCIQGWKWYQGSSNTGEEVQQLQANLSSLGL